MGLVLSPQNAAPGRSLVPIEQDIYFPPKLQILFQPSRYKILYGGRGSGKSWGVARALLILASQRPLRILCAREMQKSLKSSSYKLLVDQIKKLGLGHLFDIVQNEIRGQAGTSAEGSLFSFDGLRLDAEALKSYEGIDICWVEEAQAVSAASWKDLIPTIRKLDSNIYGHKSVAEIWLTFNPDLETDPTYVRFVKRTPSNALRVKVNYGDNPWFGEPMLTEMRDLKRDDYDEYLHVWEGNCKSNLDGAVYGDEMREATTQNRIRSRDDGGVPYDRSVPVDVVLDLGKDNYTAVIFKQIVAWEHRYIDYLQDRGKDVDFYCQQIQSRGYTIGTVWLPHDGKAKKLGSKMSIQEQFQQKFADVRIVPNLGVADGINAMRTIFSNSYFDAEKCADLVTCLRKYRYELEGTRVDPNTNKIVNVYSRTPLHDEYSDGADAARYSGVVAKMGRKAKGSLKLHVPGLSPEQEAEAGVTLARPLMKRIGNIFGAGSGPTKTDWMG